MQIVKKQARTTSKYAIAQLFSASNITTSQRTKTIFFLIVPAQYYWPLLHVSRFLYSLNQKGHRPDIICFQTYVKFQRRVQNPARFALSRDAVSGDFYWLTSYRCQSWLYMCYVLQSLSVGNIIAQPLVRAYTLLSSPPDFSP